MMVNRSMTSSMLMVAINVHSEVVLLISVNVPLAWILATTYLLGIDLGRHVCYGLEWEMRVTPKAFPSHSPLKSNSLADGPCISYHY